MTRRPDTRLTWLTCAVDGVDHAITDEAFARARGDGRYPALCEATVWAASLASPPAGRCPTCESALAGSPDRTGERSAARSWPRRGSRSGA